MSKDRADNAPARQDTDERAPASTSRAEIDAFLSHVKAL
jgi:hypothetical protein